MFDDLEAARGKVSGKLVWMKAGDPGRTQAPGGRGEFVGTREGDRTVGHPAVNIGKHDPASGGSSVGDISEGGINSSRRNVLRYALPDEKGPKAGSKSGGRHCSPKVLLVEVDGDESNMGGEGAEHPGEALPL